MQNDKAFGPRPWTADEPRRDSSWVQRLSQEEADGIVAALEHAKSLNKPLLAMEQADFPLSEASRAAL
jgi:hypothetical protein